MSIKVKAQERNISFDKNVEEYAYVLTTDLYSRLTEEKVIQEAASHSGISAGMLRASCAAVSDVLMSWISEGHSVSIPCLGTMRLGLSSKSVTNVKDVATDLITSRKVIFTPSVEIKNALANTSFSISCYDRTGKLVKRVDADTDSIPSDPDPETPNEGGGGNSNPGGDFVG
ncbi:MAG: DNA-binding protein [Bacteroidales bacterium]|nr:DNA-binding protein [Bacteroidales bacterium]